MKLSQILYVKGLDTSKTIKVARHSDTEIDINELYSKNHFEVYQKYQSKNVFGVCDYIVSFIGTENSQAVFVGVYEVKSKRRVEGFPETVDAPIEVKERLHDCKWEYELEKLDGYGDLEDRLIIKWEGVATSWCRFLQTNSIEVVQILPKGETKEFPGYLNFILKRWELESIVNNPTDNKIWHETLSTVAGVYLIVDTKTGKQYVGSAYGEEGMLGRWKTYVNNKHGGNKLLREIIDRDPERVDDFIYTILQILPITYKDREVFKVESLYKNKLGSRAFGLNSN
ncbi:GIY-YIG nuclease family protein [Bacillus cereus]|uniref:GIY-YIG nuclease family protein n=1 Tax=Bacillus cereus TaxID=1396 RepID=UPI003D1682DE